MAEELSLIQPADAPIPREISGLAGGHEVESQACQAASRSETILILIAELKASPSLRVSLQNHHRYSKSLKGSDFLRRKFLF